MHIKRYWYKLYKPIIVHGISGNYKVWADKTIADNLVIFVANQVSVIYNDQHWSANDRFNSRLRLCEATNPGISAYIGEDEMIRPIPIEEIEIDLQCFSSRTMFSTHLRHEFHIFCKKIQKIPQNEVRRIR